MSPYVVTVKRPNKSLRNPAPLVVSRRAVATLEEARKATRRKLEPFLPGGVLKGDPAKWLNAAWSVPESGGSVGPLPDGTVVEVSQVSWRTLGGEKVNASSHALQAEVLAAFNARVAS